MAKESQSDYDSGWKEAIENYFEEFFAFYFPSIHRDIDFSKRHEFLDKELSTIVKESKEKKRYADKLVKVYLKNGDTRWLLIHIEIQSSYEEDFEKRLYAYNYRIHDKYNKEVITLVILTDDNKNYRPHVYAISMWEFELIFRFPLVKLIDYQGKLDTDRAVNPFEIITIAHLQTLETINDFNQRLFYKITLIKKLYEKGYTKKEILNLYRFIDWVMVLPKDLSIKFKDTIFHYEEDKKMPYITSVERLGMEEGEKKGKKEGFLLASQKYLNEILNERFGEDAVKITNNINKIKSVETLEKLFRYALRADTLEEFTEAIDNLKKM
jgi:hypothetical protein